MAPLKLIGHLRTRILFFAFFVHVRSVTLKAAWRRRAADGIAIKFIAGLIWRFSEWSGTGLGFLAPHVLGAMLGSKPKRLE